MRSVAIDLDVAIVGLGNVGAIHLDCYLRNPSINLAAVVEPRQERIDALCLPDSLPAYTSLDAMLSELRPDVVCVATPVATHEAVTLACARAGAHVLCEKPLSLSSESAQRMIDACADAGVQLGYAASYRFLPAVKKARELIAEGVLGDVRVIREQAVGGAPVGGGVAMGFAHYPEGGPGGSGMGLVDHGIHFIDIFPWLLNDEIVCVHGRGNVSGEPPGAEWMQLVFAGGAIGSLLYDEQVYSSTLPSEGLFTAGAGWDIDQGFADAGAWSGSPGCIEVSGTKGALRIFHYAHRLFLKTVAGTSELPLATEPPPAHFASQMIAFLEALACDEPAPVSAEAGLRALQRLLDVYA